MEGNDTQKLSVYITWKPTGSIDIDFANLDSVLGRERAMQFMTIMSRSLWTCHIRTAFIDNFRVSVARSESAAPFIISPHDFLRVTRDEIKRVACVAGFECDFLRN